MTRDAVRMLVAHKGDGSLVHTHFSELPRFLDEGDLVVLNTSGTLAAEVDGIERTASPADPPLDPAPGRTVDVEVRRRPGLPGRRSGFEH